MIKDFLSSSGACIRLLILLIILINDSWAQILPSSFGVHHKKNASTVNYALSFDGSATGASNSGDVVTFSNITIQDGFYAIATTDTNL